MRKVQLTVDAIDACVKTVKKEVADSEARREHLLSGVVGPYFRPLLHYVVLCFPYFLSLSILPSILLYFSSTYLISLT